MSNYLAIATVTAALKELIDKSLRASGTVADPTGADPFGVTTLRPSDGEITKRGVNVFLHHASPNPHWRNDDLPTRRADGSVVRRPAVALDLHYVLTFHGKDSHWEPQRFYGATVRTLHAQPTLSRGLVQRAIDSIGATANFAFIRDSDLARAVEQVRFVPSSVSLDDLSKLWSSFYQTHYWLTAVYTASPVLIEADEAAQEAMPVRSTAVRAVPFAQPVIERVRSASGDPITAGSALRIEGSNLRGEITELLIDDQLYQGTLDAGYSVVAATLSTTAPTVHRAGIRRAQIVHSVALGAPPRPHRGVESNVVPFVIVPTVEAAPAPAVTVDPAASRVVAGQTLLGGVLTVTVAPRVERTQRALVLLNGTDASAPPAYSFAAKPRPSGSADPIDAAAIEFPFRDVMPGTYYLRVQVDGATSVPPANAQFPTVTFTGGP